MDIGCLDLCSISVKSNEKSSLDFGSKLNDVGEPLTASSKIRKNKNSKEAGQSSLNISLNKFTSQIKKPPRRKTSPVNWFPRKKGDSYLERKIKMLQEIGGMNSTLDETLGDSNPHYCRVLREKMAAKEAAHRALEARKAALVEASWCRILKAARIQSKEAEAQLLQAEKTAVEAVEAATAKGVIMYDTPNCPKKLGQIETSSIGGGGSTTTTTTHAVTASFETAFEVDKEVAAAVKTALTRLANCPSSFSKDEFKELLRKISQNPDTDQNNEELSEFSSESGSSELETVSQKDGFITSQDLKCKKIPVLDTRQRKNRRRKSLEKLNMTKIVDMMFERLQSLQEDEISSIATIVATCGLNAALAEVEGNKLHQPGSTAPNFSRRMSSLGAGKHKEGHVGRKKNDTDLPSLDKFLVKHMTKLEREVQEAKNSRKNEAKEITTEEKEDSEMEQNNKKGLDQPVSHLKEDVQGLPSLDKFLVKHVSKLEKEVQEAKNRRKNEGVSQQSKMPEAKDALDSLDKILVKPVHRLQREKMQASANDYRYKNIQRKKQGGESVNECESLDKVLVKHVSRLEKEKMRKLGQGSKGEEWMEIKRYKENRNLQKEQVGGGFLDQIMVKHKSKLEREKMDASANQESKEETKFSLSRKESRERELQEAWGGLGLGSMRPHVSKLERDKAAWIKAEEEEKKQVLALL